MRILAIDMGWCNSVCCLLSTRTGKPEFQKVATASAVFAETIDRLRPDQVAIEAGPMAGWVRDLCQQKQVRLVVLNTNDEAWKWRGVKSKTDRKDALKVARIAALGGVQGVHVPEKSVRQWRQLIEYRQTLMNQTVSIRNRIRAILLQEERHLPAGSRAWEGKALSELAREARALSECSGTELWRGMLELELRRLEWLGKLLAEVERRLDQIAAQDERVRRLKQVPGVGTRTAEAVAAMLDEADRFGRGRQVGSYAGLTPRKFQSGSMDRDGHISRCGNGLLRKLLVQAAWAGKKSDARLAAIYQRVRRNNPRRTKQAIVAVARHLLVWMWAMLRDKSDWRPAGGRCEAKACA